MAPPLPPRFVPLETGAAEQGPRSYRSGPQHLFWLLAEESQEWTAPPLLPRCTQLEAGVTDQGLRSWQSGPQFLFCLLLKESSNEDVPSLRRVIRAIKSKNAHSFARRLRRRWKDVPLDAMRSEDGQNLLHVACKNGRLDLIPYLMERGVSVDERDDDGCIPAHLAIKWCPSHDVDDFLKRHLVPMSESCSRLLDVQDSYGCTCNDYLEELKEQERRTMNAMVQADEEDKEDRDEEDRYASLLQSAMDSDYRDVHGRYSETADLHLESSNPETFDDWVERMMREHAARHQRPKVSKPRPPSPEYAPRLGVLKPEMVEVRRVSLQTRVEASDRRWEELMSEGKDGIRFSDIPWPTYLQTLASISSSELPAEDRGRFLKSLQRRWHPDKFNQRLGHRLAPEDAERIRNRVLEVSQICNDLISNSQDS